ncbi:MAG: hypothetical protein WC969_08730 [Elusimicrobiota bacterium]|jgi:hypothetical protein
MMNFLGFLAVLASSALALEPAAVPAKSGAPAQGKAASSSSDTVKALTVGDIYGGGRYRDPFRLPSAGSGPAVIAKEGEGGGETLEFSIHSLNLKGILKDQTGASALLVDPRTGSGYLLKSGRLFDYKNHRVAGVTGVIQQKQKSVILMTPDKDVQTLRLGEEEDAAAEKAQ